MRTAYLATLWLLLFIVAGLVVGLADVGSGLWKWAVADLTRLNVHLTRGSDADPIGGRSGFWLVLSLALLQLAYLAVLKWPALGALSALALIGWNRPEESSSKPLLLALASISLVPGAAWLAVPWLEHEAGVTLNGVPNVYLWFWLAWLAAGLLAGLVWLRLGVAALERLRRRLTKRSALERNRRTDVREIDRFLPDAIGSFDPLRYIDEDKGVFVGLDEGRRPIHIPEDTWRESHILLSGRTRSGKGVAAQILLVQAIRRKELVVVLDPKSDMWMPHVFKREADRCGQPYRYLDLRQPAPPQINLFQGCDEETLENMFIAAFGLAEKGTDADHYRLKDRRAALEAARFIAANPGVTPSMVLAQLGPAWDGVADGFQAAMQEMAELQAVNRSDGQGVDIQFLEASGGCLYVVGDMGNTRVIRMQRMLLVRLMMLAKTRVGLDVEPRTITVLADEFKVHISRPFMASLATMAGAGMHCILAFQSLQDLADVPSDLDKEAVKGSVNENCAIQLSYRIKDPDTAEWLAASTGVIQVDDEIRTVDKNLALTETVRTERTLRQGERHYVDANMFMNLPKGCGVLVGATKLATFCYTSPVSADRGEDAITPSVPPRQETGESGRPPHRSGCPAARQDDGDEDFL